MNRKLMNERIARVSKTTLGILMAGILLVVADSAIADGAGNADVVSDVGCMQDSAGFNLGCTAGDVKIASVTNLTILDDGCAFIDDTVTFSADFELQLTAQARHDIGLWFAQDGDPNGDGAITGICTAATPAFAPDPPWLDLDGTSDDPDGITQDTCGDIDGTHTPLFPSVTLTVACRDEDADGQLDLPNCTSWRQPGVNDLCTDPTQAFPGAPSKCRCDNAFGVPIAVPGGLTAIDKVTVDADGNPLPGDPTVFSFSFIGPDPDLPFDFTLTDAQDPVSAPGVFVGTYNLSEAPEQGWELISAVCTSSHGNPDQDLIASGGDVVVNNAEALTCTFTNRQTFVAQPMLSLAKTADPATYSAAGDVISYSYLVTNTGNVPISGPIAVMDDNVDAEPTCPPGDLAPTESMTCTAQYTIAEADLEAGSVVNVAVASGTDPDGESVFSEPDDETVHYYLAALGIVKTGTPATYSEVGQIIAYTFEVTNDGTVDVYQPITVDDDQSIDESCPPTPDPLEPGDSITCSASHTIGQDDLDNGSVTNIASATGLDADGNPVESPTDTETVDAIQSPALTIDKSASPTTYDAVGQVISYSYLVTNTGNVTISGPISVSDDNVDAAATCPAGDLAPNASLTCSAIRTVTQDDLDGGSITNIASASGTDPNGNPVESPTDTETVDAIQSPALTIDKSASPATYDAVGQVISYSYLVTNTGNVTISGPIAVTDDNVDAEPSCPGGDLAPTESMTCSAIRTVTQVDLDGGSIINIAFASGADPSGNPVDSPTDSETATAVQNPQIDLSKSSEFNDDLVADGYAQVGETITYTFVAANTGNVTLSGVIVSDSLPGLGALSCTPAQPAMLAPGEVMTCTAGYSLTQADIDAGTVHNEALASGEGPQGQPADDTDANDQPIPQNPSVLIEKDFAGDEQESVIAGEGGSFTLWVSNDGNVTIHDALVEDLVDSRLHVTAVAVTDGTADCAASSGQIVSCTISVLAPGESASIEVDFSVDPSVPESLDVLNTASVSGTTDTAGPVSDEDSDTIDILVEIELAIVKNFYTIDEETGLRIDGGPVEQGKNGFFELVVTNAGPSDAVNVLVTDAVNELLGVVEVQPQPACSASSGQDVSCTVDVPVGDVVIVLVEYAAAEFLDPELNPESGGLFGTMEGDEFRFAFVNGYVLEGSTDDGPVFLTDPDGNVTELEYFGTKNEIFFDPDGDGPEAGFTMHLSCSDLFTGGWGQSGGPVEGLDVDWQVASYSILRYHNGGQYFKGCGDVVVPWNVDNTAFADGTDSNSPPESELVSDTASVQIVRQLKVEIRSEPVTKGKKLDVLLNNTGQDALTIARIELSWPAGAAANGSLTSVLLGTALIYDTTEPVSPAIIDGDDGDGSPWVGNEADRTIAPGQALKLGFFFQRKTLNTGYTVIVVLEGGLTTEVVTVSK